MAMNTVLIKKEQEDGYRDCKKNQPSEKIQKVDGHSSY